MPQPLLDLSPFLSNQGILFLENGTDKQQALEQLAATAAQGENVTDPDAFRLAIFEREQVSSTGIGKGVALPHAKLPSNTGFSITIGISSSGIAYDASDDKDVYVIFMIAASDKDRKEYLRLLATVASTLKNENSFLQLQNTSSAQEVLDLLKL